MNERGLVWLTIPRLLIVVTFSVLYVSGGRSGKVLFRRILGSLTLAGGVALLALVVGSFKWWILLGIPGYFIALSLGYGGKSLPTKFFRRFLYGLALGACSFIYAPLHGLYLMAGYQTLIALFSSLFLGILNPTKAAVNEESLIAVASVFTIPFMV